MNSTSISRRSWLKTAGVAAVGAGLGVRCATRSSAQRNKVNVSAARVIRTVAGLRPFRPSGFLVKSETFDKKTVIHNYGHGGGGVTMSWGTSHLAVEKALETGEDTFAVVGCGALGMATARLLQKRGHQATIYAKDLPPGTTSNVACASWYPAESADPDKRTPEWIAEFTRAARLSYNYYQDLIGVHYAVHWLQQYALSEDPPEDRGVEATDSPLRDLFPETVDLGPREHPFGTAIAAATGR